MTFAKRLLKWFMVVALFHPLALKADWTFTVTNTPTAITVPAGLTGINAIVVRENSTTPSATYTIWNAYNQGSYVTSGTGASIPSGESYIFTRTQGYLFSSPTVIGYIKSTGAGPYTFIALVRSGTTQNATTALALATTPTQCSNQVALGISSNGNANCATVPASALPSGVLSCQVLDNAICTSSVDASGNPNFLAADATPPKIDINGASTPLVLFIGGVYQTLTSNVTVTPATPGSDTEYFVYVKQDTSSPTLQAADFGVTTIPPTYTHTAPTCSASATASNPHIWFNLAANTMEFCTSNGGAFSAQPAYILGAAGVSSAPACLGVVAMPYRLNPYKIRETFGGAGSGSLVVTSGTTTVNGLLSYSSIFISGATAVLTHSPNSNNSYNIQWHGLFLRSQNPVLVVNSGSVNANALGAVGNNCSNGNGTVGMNVASLLGGQGGGGGGTASYTGGIGGFGTADFFIPNSPFALASGNNGTSGSGVGGAGLNTSTSQNLESIYGEWMAWGIGPSGACGGGDGTNLGGRGGYGGGVAILVGPSIYVASGSSLTANGQAGVAASTGNAGGGGGGAGGTVLLIGGFVSQNGTISATGGAYGAGVGTGAHGGAGGNGTATTVRLW